MNDPIRSSPRPSPRPSQSPRLSPVRLLWAGLGVTWALVTALSLTYALVSGLITGYWSVIGTLITFLALGGLGAALLVFGASVVIVCHARQRKSPGHSDPESRPVSVEDLDLDLEDRPPWKKS